MNLFSFLAKHKLHLTYKNESDSRFRYSCGISAWIKDCAMFDKKGKQIKTGKHSNIMLAAKSMSKKLQGGYVITSDGKKINAPGKITIAKSNFD